MPSSYRFAVTGRVQGVGFREAARRKALQLGVRGWIANRADGAVEGLACGEAAALGQFRTWLGDGPPLSRVLTLKWEASAETPPESFEARR
jgi:acylphosphatase